MRKRLVLAFLCCGFLGAQPAAPDRKVQGNALISGHDPAVRIQLPKDVRYLAAVRFNLYEVADCELHVFVEADANNNVQRLYWVQFEGYLPTKPDLHYQYDSPRQITIGGLDFYVDTWVRSAGTKTRPGSDREHVHAVIRAKGYKMPPGMMYVRLVHLLDEQKRKELMIVYGEDLSTTGRRAADLEPGGRAHASWPAIDKGLVERAQQSIAVEPMSGH